MREFFGGDKAESSPIDIIQLWLREARACGDVEVDAVDLATVDENGMPNLRIVYIREFEPDGLVFYTNYLSRKGRELASGKAAINFYFPIWQRQIRVRGLIEKVSAAQSDAYFFGRPEGSRLGAWMSQQSEIVESRAQMEAELKALTPEKANFRPPHWGGFRLFPSEVEFWAMGEYRIHDRFQWERQGEEWRVTRRYP